VFVTVNRLTRMMKSKLINITQARYIIRTVVRFISHAKARLLRTTIATDTWMRRMETGTLELFVYLRLQPQHLFQSQSQSPTKPATLSTAHYHHHHRHRLLRASKDLTRTIATTAFTMASMVTATTVMITITVMAEVMARAMVSMEVMR